MNSLVLIVLLAIFIAFIMADFHQKVTKPCIVEEIISPKFAIINCNGKLQLSKRVNYEEL